MKKCTVKTKKELQKALEKKEECIIIDPMLMKEIVPIIEIWKLTPQKISTIVGFLGVSGAAIVASMAAAPATLGVSALASIPALIATSTASGVSTVVIVGVIVLCVAMSIPTVIALISDYEIEDDFEVAQTGVKIKRKYKSK